METEDEVEPNDHAQPEQIPELDLDNVRNEGLKVVASVYGNDTLPRRTRQLPIIVDKVKQILLTNGLTCLAATSVPIHVDRESADRRYSHLVRVVFDCDLDLATTRPTRNLAPCFDTIHAAFSLFDENVRNPTEAGAFVFDLKLAYNSFQLKELVGKRLTADELTRIPAPKDDDADRSPLADSVKTASGAELVALVLGALSGIGEEATSWNLDEGQVAKVKRVAVCCLARDSIAEDVLRVFVDRMEKKNPRPAFELVDMYEAAYLAPAPQAANA
jgi:hypothetical protein